MTAVLVAVALADASVVIAGSFSPSLHDDR